MRSASKFDLCTDAHGRDEQKERVDNGFVDVARMFVEPPPRAGVGQLAELLLERREAGLVVGHGVLAGAGVDVGLLFGRGAARSFVGWGVRGRGQPLRPAVADGLSFFSIAPGYRNPTSNGYKTY